MTQGRHGKSRTEPRGGAFFVCFFFCSNGQVSSCRFAQGLTGSYSYIGRGFPDGGSAQCSAPLGCGVPAARVLIRRASGCSSTHVDGIGCGHGTAVDNWPSRGHDDTKGKVGTGLGRDLTSVNIWGVTSVDPVPGLVRFHKIPLKLSRSGSVASPLRGSAVSNL